MAGGGNLSGSRLPNRAARSGARKTSGKRGGGALDVAEAGDLGRRVRQCLGEAILPLARHRALPRTGIANQHSRRVFGNQRQRIITLLRRRTQTLTFGQQLVTFQTGLL